MRIADLTPSMDGSSTLSALNLAGERRHESLTLAVCSNRVENLRKHLKSYMNSLRLGDRLLIVLDLQADAIVERLTEELDDLGAKTFVNGRNLGLSASRNIALEVCTTSYLIFIDDDIVVAKQAVDSIRYELRKGADIVGVRINGPKVELRIPWYISEGQLHYLAIHNPKSVKLNTWGACMGLNLPLVKANNLRFRVDLGRGGRGLMSGEDTTFLREMKMKGAKEAFLNESCVSHNIDRQRVSLSYMLRRAYWQGRSEFRRRDSLNGLKKEWTRFFDCDAPPTKKAALALVYITCVVVGMLRELLDWCGANLAKTTTRFFRRHDKAD